MVLLYFRVKTDLRIALLRSFSFSVLRVDWKQGGQPFEFPGQYGTQFLITVLLLLIYYAILYIQDSNIGGLHVNTNDYSS